MTHYHPMPGGLPAQHIALTDRAVFSEAYAVIPHAVMRDIVVSYLPHWRNSRFWVLARPLTGFAETFSYYLAEIEAGGGSESPDTDPTAQSVLFVVQGEIEVRIGERVERLGNGGYAYIPAHTPWQIENVGDIPAGVHWIRKRYCAVQGIDHPDAFFINEADVAAIEMPDCDGVWSTQRFVDPTDLRHDFHVNIVNFKPGGRIPFEETHVMEHALFVLSGEAEYKLNTDWHHVGAGDFMWLRAFCPQACVAKGSVPFRYLLYKDVNRHASLTLGAPS